MKFPLKCIPGRGGHFTDTSVSLEQMLLTFLWWKAAGPSSQISME